MPYYKLDEEYAFRGWKRLPYALRAMEGEKALRRPLFFDKEQFMALLSCNGEENISLDELTQRQKKLLENLTHEGVLHTSAAPMGALAGYQRYYVYPSIYLESVHWSITGKCNYKCRHCLLSAPTNCHPQLPLKDCLHIVDQISKCGIRQVDLTGGEPFVRTDFIELAKALSEHHISIRTIFTNASLLTEELLDALEDMGQHPTFQISYDGVGHHAWLRGIPEAEGDVLRSIKMLHRRNIPYTCAMCIHKENAQSLANTVRLLAKYGCTALRLNTPQELGTWKEYADEYALSWQEAWELYKAYIPVYFKDGMPLTIDLDGFVRCTAHSTKYSIPYMHHANEKMNLAIVPYCESVKYNAYIDAEGRLVPCMGFADMAIKDKFPSLLNEDMATATWNSFYTEVARTSVQQMIDHNPDCQKCEHVYDCCGGCMVEGATADGDYLQYDPHCCWFHKNVGEAAVRAVADAAIQQYAAEIKAKEGEEAATENKLREAQKNAAK